MYEYITQGTCSQRIAFSIEDGKVHSISFVSGCDGNLKGISRLCEGMDAQQLIASLKGIRCGRKNTSCPDQLARAVEQALEKT